MERRVERTDGRVTTGHPGGARRFRVWTKGGLFLLMAGLTLAAGSATAQERRDTSRAECRCVDRDGNPIENCTCFRTPDFGRIWTVQPPNRARIGITVRTDQHPRYERDGAYVQSVLEGGPADRAGLREGDIIVRVDGHSLFDPLEDDAAEQRLDLDESVPVQRLLSILADVQPGDEVEIEYLRNGETHKTTMQAERNPDQGGVFSFGLGDAAGILSRERFGGGVVIPRSGRSLAFGFPDSAAVRLDSLLLLGRDSTRTFLFNQMDPCFSAAVGSGTITVFGHRCIDGVEVTELNAGLGEYFGTDRGVLVTDVLEGSTLGLRPGDVILAIDGREVRDRDQLHRILQSYDTDEELTLRIMRQGEEMEITGRRR